MTMFLSAQALKSRRFNGLCRNQLCRTQMTNSHDPYCSRCLSKKYRNSPPDLGDNCAAPNVLTDADKQQIVKRIRRFEKPITVARDFNITTDAVRNIMKQVSRV